MVRVFARAGSALIAVFSLLALAEPATNAQGAPAQVAQKSVWDGVYTIDQAKRGEQIYRTKCTMCHRANLLGNSVDGGPPLRGPEFNSRWKNHTIQDVVAMIQDLMPFDNPGSLSRQQYVDVFSFILWANEMPAGSNELPAGAEQLKQIVMTDKSEGRP